jgi:hypothetical protein
MLFFMSLSHNATCYHVFQSKYNSDTQYPLAIMSLRDNVHMVQCPLAKMSRLHQASINKDFPLPLVMQLIGVYRLPWLPESKR